MSSEPPIRYAVEMSAKAERALGKLDKQTARRIGRALVELSRDPRPPGTKSMVGMPGALRHRVGDYRIVYRIYDDHLVVLVLTLGHRRDVYRDR